MAEVMVAVLMFSIAVAGVFASISAIQRPEAPPGVRLGGALCGQQFLQQLRANVDARDWDSGKLKAGLPGGPPIVPWVCTQNGQNYNMTYTITQMANGNRKVTVTATW